MNIIELAKQADLYLDGENTQKPLYVLSPDELTRFAHLVRADDTALLRQALYVIEAWDRGCDENDYSRDRDAAIAALRERLGA